MEPPLAAVGSATVAVLSQSSDIERPFFAMMQGHVVYNNCGLYMLLYKQQCRGFYCCSKESSKREVCVPGTPSSLEILCGILDRNCTVLAAAFFSDTPLHDSWKQT